MLDIGDEIDANACELELAACRDAPMLPRVSDARSYSGTELEGGTR